MATALLIDFGSTYTKVAAVDLDEARLIGRAQAPSTVDTDVSWGLSRALQLLKSRSKLQEEEVTVKLACSSAAGGLRMVAVGLIPHLTAEAANRAALGAGAKVVKVYGKELNDRTVPELEAINPDIILLAGGIDGGNRDVIVHNARRIANSRVRSPVVVAGNVDAQDEVAPSFSRPVRRRISVTTSCRGSTSWWWSRPGHVSRRYSYAVSCMPRGWTGQANMSAR